MLYSNKYTVTLCNMFGHTGCWYIRQMDPLPPSTTPPSMHLSWNSCNLSKQLLFDSDSSSPGVFFLLLVDMGLGAAVGGMRLEINSCYLIRNNSRHKMALQLIIELNSYSSFSYILVFVCLCLCLCLSHIFICSIFTMTSMTFSQSFLWHPHIPRRSTASKVIMCRGQSSIIGG